MTTEITDEGASARVNAEVVLKVVPLAEDILLACARCVNALQENDTSLGIWVLELICFIAYFTDLVLEYFAFPDVTPHDEYGQVLGELIECGTILPELACSSLVLRGCDRGSSVLDMSMLLDISPFKY